MREGIMKAVLFSLGLIPCLMFVEHVQAQISPGSSNSIQNSGSIPPARSDNFRPIGQQNFLIDSNRGSQQFFRDGRESLYFLPAGNTESILKIDETSDIQEADQKEKNDVDSEEQLNHQ